MTDLAEAATAGLSAVPDQDGADQQQLEGTDYAKVKFNGVQYDDIESGLKIGDEVACRVHGRVTGVGDKVMKDGHIRHEITVTVDSVQLQD